jgi:hypothetical protein
VWRRRVYAAAERVGGSNTSLGNGREGSIALSTGAVGAEDTATRRQAVTDGIDRG